MTLTPELWQRVRTLFHAALDLEGAQRQALLDAECGDDAALRLEVESLLRSAEGAATFLEVPAAALADPVAVPPAWIGRRLGAYEVTALLGSGGMGEVYRAIRADDQYRQSVAVKLMRPGYAGELTLARFRAERQILASLEHPNIARLLDAGIATSGEPYFVMQLVEGEPIDRYCDSQALSLAQRLRLFCRVCDAVQYAHQHLTVHRDIKPANILVTAAGAPMLLDFGIAKVLAAEGGAQETRGTLLAMTPEYASPEQVRGGTVTTASDVYSLGVVLYRLLTGRSPYRATHTEPYTLAREVVETEPVRPSARLEHPGDARPVTGDLDAIVLMAMRKEPARRYASAHELATDLRRHLDGLPVSAAPDTWRYRAAKFVGRHRVSVAIAMLAMLGALVGISVIIVEARIAQDARARAERRFDDMRGLANSLIFDLDDAVAKLPGSTQARRLLVVQALKYLDALSRDARDEASLQRDLGSAYQKLGDIQGNPVRGNLGLIAEARQSYDKAIAIRQSLVSADPRNTEDQLALASSYEWLADFLHATNGDLTASLGYARQAHAIYDRLYRADEDPKVARRLIGVYETFAVIQGGSGSSSNLGDVDAAIASTRQGLAIAEKHLERSPHDETMQRIDAMLHVYLADYLVKQGDRAGAEAQYETSLKTFEAINALSPSVDNQRTISLVSSRIGNALSMDGQFATARPRYEASRQIDAREAAADPGNALARYDLSATLGVLGNATARAGDVKEGLRLLDQAIDPLATELRRDDRNFFARRMLSLLYVLRGQVRLAQAQAPLALTDFDRAAEQIARDEDPSTRISAAAIRVKRGHALARLHEVPRAREEYLAALSGLAPWLEAPRPPVEALYAAADANGGLGALPDTKMAERCAPSGYLHRALDLYRRIRNPGVMDPTGFEASGPEGLNRQLAACEGRSAPGAGTELPQAGPSGDSHLLTESAHVGQQRVAEKTQRGHAARARFWVA